ncbi:hypothetical protein GIB67_040800 [Kingdonia uniflora]|uniref:Uncharacterized protein n=1 Tax=Kingdonia uniflora TaxID=39325 RepID=A0A7J7P4D5_9MAGN|nr:hypothetical protein GIB67_040800 [Kingdonia uniflora]
MSSKSSNSSGEEAEMNDKVEPVNLKLAPEAPSALLPLDGNSCATDSDETKSDVGQSSSSSKPDLIVDPKSEIIDKEMPPPSRPLSPRSLYPHIVPMAQKVIPPVKRTWYRNIPEWYTCVPYTESPFITLTITPKNLKKLNDKLAERKDWNPTTDVAYDHTIVADPVRIRSIDNPNCFGVSNFGWTRKEMAESF